MAFMPLEKDSFWAMANELSFDVATLFESVNEEQPHVYQTQLDDDPREDSIVNPQSTMRMRIERTEVLWENLQFKLKARAIRHEPSIHQTLGCRRF